MGTRKTKKTKNTTTSTARKALLGLLIATFTLSAGYLGKTSYSYYKAGLPTLAVGECFADLTNNVTGQILEVDAKTGLYKAAISLGIFGSGTATIKIRQFNTLNIQKINCETGAPL